MRISLNWLTDYVDISLPAERLGELFTAIGLNCDGIEQTADDVVFDLDVTSNRPDWLGHLGVARELAAATGAGFRPPTDKVRQVTDAAQQTSPPVAKRTDVEVLAPDLCPRYTARVIEGLSVRPSPAWMVERLQAAGLRAINNVVDVTNYVLMEYSQPLHSFDFDKLGGGRIVVRRARDGEHVVSIDGTKCALSADMLVIADAVKPVALAGIMGGLDSEVGERTRNVLIEAAQFDPLSIRRTSRALGLMSESNYRFERGVDPVRVDEASLRACQLMLELGGGRLLAGVVDRWARPFVAPVVSLRPARTNALLGMDVPTERQAEILAALGLSPRMQDGLIVCTVPPHRGDLTREADLIEEIARLHGYDKLPLGGTVTHAVGGEAPAQRLRRRVGEVLSAAGFDEAVTPTFVDVAEESLWGQQHPVCVREAVRKSNNALRSTLLPSLLRSCKINQDAGTGDVRLFEVAAVFPRGSGRLPDEYVQLGMVTTGEMRALRGALEALVCEVGQAHLEVMPEAAPGFDPGLSGLLKVGGVAAGALGAVAPAVLEHYGLERPVQAAVLRLDCLSANAFRVRKYSPLPRFPGVSRDLSLIVDESVAWGFLEQAIAAVPQPMRQELRYVTTYRGKPIPAGKKSVTVALTYRSDEGTLRSEQVDELVAQLLEGLRGRLEIEIRT